MVRSKKKKEKKMTEAAKNEKAQGLERGTPSPHLTQAQGGVVDDGSGDYEMITDAAPESGIFHIIGGYLDDEGVVHNEVLVRSLSGKEEDMMGNQSIHIMDRLQSLMAACTERIGKITDKGQITNAIHRLPVGSREDLIIAIRRVTHWKRFKDNYEMNVRCPIAGCRKEWGYNVNLGELDRYDMPEPTKREFTESLLDSGDEIVWRVASLPQERVFYVVGNTTEEEHLFLSYGIMMRLVSVNGEDVRLDIGDVLTDDRKKIRFSKKAEKLLLKVQNYSSGDRGQLRDAFELHEPVVNRDVDFECHHCHQPFVGSLDITQRSFFFPFAVSRRSKRRFSI